MSRTPQSRHRAKGVKISGQTYGGNGPKVDSFIPRICGFLGRTEGSALRHSRQRLLPWLLRRLAETIEPHASTVVIPRRPPLLISMKEKQIKERGLLLLPGKNVKGLRKMPKVRDRECAKYSLGFIKN